MNRERTGAKHWMRRKTPDAGVEDFEVFMGFLRQTERQLAPCGVGTFNKPGSYPPA
jgi:hypothetical protein